MPLGYLNLSVYPLKAALPTSFILIIMLLFDLRSVSIIGLTSGLEISYDPPLANKYLVLDPYSGSYLSPFSQVFAALSIKMERIHQLWFVTVAQVLLIIGQVLYL